jgi:membrane-associated protein
MAPQALLALAGIAGLLFVEELGVPLFMFPADGLLLTAGTLVGTGALPAWLVIPVLSVVDVTGSFLGYSWTRWAGARTLYQMADRFGAREALGLVEERVATWGTVGILVGRIIPGIRVYTSLLAGALQVPRRRFLPGMVPGSVIWIVVVCSLGALFGHLAHRYLTEYERAATEAVLALAAALLLASGVRLLWVSRRPRRPATD